MGISTLKRAIRSIIQEYLFERFSYIFMPSNLYAKVTKIYINDVHKIDIKILDINKNEDETYPELAEIYTDMPFEKDDIVLVGFIGGELEEPIVIRKVT